METINLARLPEYRGVLSEMTERLFDMCLRTNDPWMEVAFQRGLTTVDAKTEKQKSNPITSV